MRAIILLGILSLAYLLVQVVGRWVQRRSTPLFPTARGYALSLSVAIYDYLCGVGEGAHLLTLAPTVRERVALSEVVATISRDIAECRPVRVRVLARAWHLEEVLTHRALCHRGGVSLRALRDLLALHPTEGCVERVSRKYYPSAAHSLAQLLLVIYTTPSRVVTLLARHPHDLSWNDMGEIVAVLKMRTPLLSPMERDGEESANVDMLVLYLAAVEGVGNAAEVARECSASADRGLRTAALNVLFGEELFPTPPPREIGS